MRFALVSIAFAFLLAGCVTNSAQSPSTPSGSPEVTIRAPVNIVKALVIARAASNKLTLTRDSEHSLQFEKRTDNVAAAVFLGSRYDGVPAERYIVTFIPLDGHTRVIVAFMIVTNPGSAFERVNPITTGDGIRVTQDTLLDIKRQAEERTVAAEAPLPPPPSKKKRN